MSESCGVLLPPGSLLVRPSGCGSSLDLASWSGVSFDFYFEFFLNFRLYVLDKQVWQFSLWMAWMFSVLFPMGLTQCGWDRPCSHACSMETEWAGPSSPQWEKEYVDFLPWFLHVQKCMCMYTRVKMLLYTWVTLASVVRRCFCKLKGTDFFPSSSRWGHRCMKMCQDHGVYVHVCPLRGLLLFWNFSTICFLVTEGVFTCLML